MSVMCSVLSRQLQAHKSKKPQRERRGFFSFRWWPGAELITGGGCLILLINYFQLRFSFLCDVAQSLK
jgi:hypothetical protein